MTEPTEREMEGMIDITGADLVEVVKAAYDLSWSQGLGWMLCASDGLTDEEAASFVDAEEPLPVRMDYVRGRSCKFRVFNRDGRLWIRDEWYDHSDEWYDHSDEQLRQLLQRIGVEKETTDE